MFWYKNNKFEWEDKISNLSLPTSTIQPPARQVKNKLP